MKITSFAPYGTGLCPNQNREYIGMLDLTDATTMFGKNNMKTTRGVSLKHMDLGLLSFIATGPLLPGIDKSVELSEQFKTAVITGSASAHGRRRRESMSLSMYVGGLEKGPLADSARFIAGVAMQVANGNTSASVKFAYDGSLVVPNGVDRVPVEQDRMYISPDSNRRTITIGDPYMPHPDADKYPTLYGKTPQEQLFGNRAVISANQGDLRASYHGVFFTLGQIHTGDTGSTGSSTDLQAMYTEAIGVPTELFNEVLAMGGQIESPTKAARAILNLL